MDKAVIRGSTLLLSAALLMNISFQTARAESATSQFSTGPILVFDPFSGQVLAESRAGELWYPASLTKLMTGLVIFNKLREGKLALDQQLLISPLSASQPASKVGIPAGQTVSLNFALQAMLVYSANDMSYVLAEAASGTVEGFAAEMNGLAASMGLSASHFVNPNGLFDPRHISSARDMGLIAARLIRDFPEQAHFFKQEFVVAGRRKLPNHNSLLRIMPEAVGMKTGFVCNSGYNLVASAIVNGQQLISVVMGARSGGARAKVSKTLLENGFATLGQGGHSSFESITNQQMGALVPADLTQTVCKQKQPVTPVNAHHLWGWGVNFGKFEKALEADMALRGRVINSAAIDVGGAVGVIALENKGGYLPLMWGLDQNIAIQMCKSFQKENATCEVMSDVSFAQLAAAAPAEIPPDQAKPADTSVSKTKQRKRPAKKGKKP